MNRRQLFAGLGAALVAGRSEAGATSAAQKRASKKMHGADYFEHIEVLTHENKRVRFYEDLVQDKVVVISMMYATCEGICPPNTANLKRVHTLLGDRVGKDIFFYSITLRPQDDTPAVLQRYVRENEIGKGWTFLTGTQRDIESLRYKLGFYDVDPAVDGDRAQHTGILRIANDVYDRWVMSPAIADPEHILYTIASVDRDRGSRTAKALRQARAA